MSGPVPSATRHRLIRMGFGDVDGALTGLAALGVDTEVGLGAFAVAADPDLALATLVRLVDAAADPAALREVLRDGGEGALRLIRVLGFSQALGDHLVRHPSQWHDLAAAADADDAPSAASMRAALLAVVGADPAQPAPAAGVDAEQAADALRVEYRRWLLLVAAGDLAGTSEVAEVAAALSDLAAGTLEAALAIARSRIGPDAERCRLAVIAMGKCGGRELNYVSDVDVIFVAEPAPGEEEATALRIGSQLAATLIQVCGDHTAEGTIWPVDAALRPEGKAGPLVRTVNSHRGYYERWAKTWEFQALLKARPAAGDPDLGAAYMAAIAPMVWHAADRDGFVEEVQAMRRRVVANLPAAEQERQLKLGRGGLRDVEFAVQLMQLVHGRTDPDLHAPGTLAALEALTAGGYVGREDGRSLHDAYAFLRTLEHRIQLQGLRRTHVVPDDPEALRVIGRSLGYAKDPARTLEKTWRHHRREVNRLHEKLFYRPLLAAVAQIPGAEAVLTTTAARDRLAALGYADPAAALRHLEALTTGVSRTAAIQRALLPAMLGWFADAPDPDAGLFGFRRISESLGRTSWYLKMLRDEGETARRLALVLGTSRFATDLLEREPEGVKILGTEDLTPLALDRLLREMRAIADRSGGAEEAIHRIRAARRRELLRISAADLCGEIEVEQIGSGLAAVTTATLDAALAVATRHVETERAAPLPTRLAIVAMGRYGGFESGYGSDADVMFVHEPVEGADPQHAATAARSVVTELRRLLALPGSDPALEVDADLRPEGKQGPIVRTLDSYAAYYAKWSQVWEAQALLRATPVVGDSGVLDRFTKLIDPLRYPAAGVSEDELREIRRIKARVDEERLPKGGDPSMHLKLGRGALADVEWTVQLLQLRHAGEVPELRTTRTTVAVRAAVEAGLLDEDEADALLGAWRFAGRLRNAAVLVTGRPMDHLPSGLREGAAVAQQLGYEPGETTMMINDYRRALRRSYGVVDRLFWQAT